MLRYLLLFFFFLMLAGHEFGLNANLGPGLSAKNLLLYIMVAGIAINAAVTRNRSIELLSVFIPFVLLIFYAILTWVVIVVLLDRPEYSPRASLIILKSTLVDHFLTLGVFFYGVLNRRDALWLLKAIIVLIVISNAVTIVDSFNMPNLGIVESRLRDGRFEGFMGAVNDYGMLLVVFLPLTIALYLSSTGKAKWLAGIGAALTGFCLVLTASRGAFVGLIGGLTISAVFLRRFVSIDVAIRAVAISFVALAVIVPITVVIGYSDLFVNRLALFEGDAYTASSGRTTYWSHALSVMMETPLSFVTGFGAESYYFSRDFYAAMHNHYLHKLFNLGVIGLGMFLTIFASALSVVRASIPFSDPESRIYLMAFTIGLISLLITQVFGEYYRSAYLIWACLGVMLRLAVEVRHSPVEIMVSDKDRQSASQSSLRSMSAR